MLNTTMKPRLLIFSSRSAHNAPRIIREINTLADVFDIYLTGKTPLEHKDIKENIYQDNTVPFADRLVHYILRKFTGGRPLDLRFPFTLKERERLIARIKPAMVIIHEPESIPYFVRLKKKYKFKLVFNAHEYHPLEFEDKKGWLETYGKYIHRIYKRYLPELDLLINVCDSIAEKCRENYHKESIVIPNAALYYPDIKIKLTEQVPIRIIHHGVAIRERSIERMVEAMRILGSNYSLDLMLVNNDSVYFEELKKIVDEVENVWLVQPVEFNEIVPFINKYDIGLFNLPPNNYNYKVALPNKLFEFIQARLCIIVSPSVEMKKIVEENDLGRISSDYSSEATASIISSLSIAEINRYKYNADKSAEMLSAERYNRLLLDTIKNL